MTTHNEERYNSHLRSQSSSEFLNGFCFALKLAKWISRVRRKDGKSKIRSPRNSAHYEFGFRNNPDNNLIINKNWHSDTADPTSTTVMSFFSGCGGLDLGLLGGFSVYVTQFSISLIPNRVNDSSEINF